jgi:hypothetical protein
MTRFGTSPVGWMPRIWTTCCAIWEICAATAGSMGSAEPLGAGEPAVALGAPGEADAGAVGDAVDAGADGDAAAVAGAEGDAASVGAAVAEGAAVDAAVADGVASGGIVPADPDGRGAVAVAAVGLGVALPVCWFGRSSTKNAPTARTTRTMPRNASARPSRSPGGGFGGAGGGP